MPGFAELKEKQRALRAGFPPDMSLRVHRALSWLRRAEAAGEDAKLVGGDNAKNGADRLVDGVQIQTKYCGTGSKCISECFENGKLRYVNPDGSPMQIEVPSDKYDAAVQAMRNRIAKGEVPNISDPSEAEHIVKKGAFTYEQARNIARFGTVESLTYDVANGVKLAGTSFGISAAITFALGVWNGEDVKEALRNACFTGLKVGGITWAGSVITAQLGRTGIEQSLRSGTDWVVQQLGTKASAWLANGLRSSGQNIYGAAAQNYLSKELRGNVVTAVTTTVVFSTMDFARLFQGQMSGAQTFKNVATTASGIAGGSGGWIGGAAAGSALGSFVPVIGTAAGGIIGGILGALGGGIAASEATSALLDEFIEDDAKEMLRIVEEVFSVLAVDYLLSEQEAKAVIAKFTDGNVPARLREMFASNNRQSFAKTLFTGYIEQLVSQRKKVALPSDETILSGVADLLHDLKKDAGDSDDDTCGDAWGDEVPA